MAQTEFNGIGVGVSNVLSALEGAYGFGIILGTNLTLDVQSNLLTPAVKDTEYFLTYQDTGGNTVTLDIFHDPSTPYQDVFPTGVPIYFNFPGNSLYAAFSDTITIPAGASPVFRIRLPFIEAYARVTQIHFL